MMVSQQQNLISKLSFWEHPTSVLKQQPYLYMLAHNTLLQIFNSWQKLPHLTLLLLFFKNVAQPSSHPGSYSLFNFTIVNPSPMPLW